jgi:transposase
VAFREVCVVEVREVLRGWLDGGGLRTVAERAGVDRKTARRYVQAAQEAGLSREAGRGAVSDELVALVVERVRPARPGGHGAAWEALAGRREEITKWVIGGLSLVKIHDLVARSGTVVPYRTLHRFAVAECGFTGRRARSTVRVADGEPGVECQVDFAQLGYLDDVEAATGVLRRRKVHALILTAACSRHMYVHLSFGQALTDVIVGCEAAWAYFGGVFRVLIPDNLKPVVAAADSVNPRFTAGWLDYAQHAGFATDPARVRSPQDKPRVERVVQYVRNNFWAGETFTGLVEAQDAATRWCTEVAGMRMHGTLAARPLDVFAQTEQAVLLPAPPTYDQPILRAVKVHRDHHVEIAKALYSVPTDWIGAHLDARADAQLVKLFHRGRLIKTHPRQPPGGRSTDPDDLPTERAGYAMRDLDRLKATAARHGANIGIYAERLLDDPLPWTRMRAVYRLLALVHRHGPAPVEAACGKALDLDVISVAKIAAMLAKATEVTQAQLPTTAAGATGNGAGTAGRFARDPAEFTRRPQRAPDPRRHLAVVPHPTLEEDPTP